jgi:hypothetical protein
VPQPCALRQPQRTQYLGEYVEVPETAATSLELLFSATTLWAATSQQTPSAVAVPNHRNSHVSNAPHPRNIPHPCAQPARAGVRSESPNPAERTNKKTAGSHGTGGLDDRPHLLRRQVSSPAPPPSPQHFAARAFTPAPACPHGQLPNSTSPPSSTTSLTPLKQLTTARASCSAAARFSPSQAPPPLTLAPKLLARRKSPDTCCCSKRPGARFALKRLRALLLARPRTASRSQALLLVPHPCSAAQAPAPLPPSFSRPHRSHPRPQALSSPLHSQALARPDNHQRPRPRLSAFRRSFPRPRILARLQRSPPCVGP